MFHGVGDAGNAPLLPVNVILFRWLARKLGHSMFGLKVCRVEGRHDGGELDEASGSLSLAHPDSKQVMRHRIEPGVDDLVIHRE